MRRGILIPATATAVMATALYFWYEERKKRRNQMDMTSLLQHTKAVVQTPRPQFMEMPPSPLPRQSVTDVIDTRDSPPSTSAGDSNSNSNSNDTAIIDSPPDCDKRQMVVALLLLGYLILISMVSSVITLYRLC
jgi:hypothetical protein